MKLKIIHFLTKQVKGQALYFALLIASISALSLAGLLLLTHTYNYFNLKAYKLVILGIENRETFLSRNKSQLNVTNDSINSATNNGAISHSFFQRYYGCWRLTSLKSNLKKSEINTVGFTGNKTDRKTPNLFLKNSNSPLILVGNTKIKGNAYVPKAGIRPGIIQGNYYNNRQLVYGSIETSKDKLPPFRKDWIDYEKKLLKGVYLQPIKRVSLEGKMQNSFLNKTHLVESLGGVDLSNHLLSGNIIIRSAIKITVYPSSKLKDVILVAPKIELKSGVKGRFQCFSSKQITVGKKCELNFPSSIVVYKTIYSENTNKKPAIIISDNCKIKGAIVYQENIPSAAFRLSKTAIRIEKKSRLIGEVYCEGSLEFLGNIEGAIFADQFEVNAFGSKYINHLYNCNTSPFSTLHYGGLPFRKTKELYLAAWLY